VCGSEDVKRIDNGATAETAINLQLDKPRELILCHWSAADNTRLLPLYVFHHSTLQLCEYRNGAIMTMMMMMTTMMMMMLTIMMLMTMMMLLLLMMIMTMMMTMITMMMNADDNNDDDR
jgi:hypothetical protein